MSKDLPLWEDDESDVRVENRLQFGHVLIVTNDLKRVLKKIISVFRLSNPVSVSDTVIEEKIPVVAGGNVRVLNDENSWHFVLVRSGRIVAVFGPHKQFFGSGNWIKVSRKLRTLITFVSQTDLDSYFYYFFLSGRHICNAYQNLSGIHEAIASPIEVYFNGKPIYKYREEGGKLTEEMRQLISQDFVIYVDDQKRIRFKSTLSDDFIEPDEICHAVFNVKIREDKNCHNDSRHIQGPVDILIEKVGGLFVR